MDLIVNKLKDICLEDHSPLRLRRGRTVKRPSCKTIPSISSSTPSPPSIPALSYWKCEVAGNPRATPPILRCRGRDHTKGLFNPVIVVQDHDHESNPELYDKYLCLNEGKRLAKETSDNPRTIINKIQKSVSSDSAIELTRPNAMTQIINRARNASICQSLFLWDDSCPSDPNRIIIFSSEHNIDLMNDSSVLYVDGTFKVALIFKQVITINVNYRGKNLPLVYSLLPNNQQVTYTRFFTMLINNEIKQMKSPDRFIVDFEMAIANSLKNLFESRICGSFFHYTQSIWRNVSLKGLINVFNDDPLNRLTYRRIKSLPFLKVKHIIKAFKEIVKETPDSFQPFLDYFEKYYIGLPVKGSTSLREVPSFPRELWNVHDQTLSGIPRTNNSLESWHKQFSQSICDHPDVNDLVKKFREEQHSMEISYKQLRSGDSYSRKKSEQSKDELLIKIIQSYGDMYLLKTLDDISETVRLN
ncbi:unnamed protein product [Brachionus calyciflorus]|uniref:MULE transposase domain-containing protein n=1 Tax=Brachionus calyciflorus TaxID=104777 RepID=A0A814HSZ4_9BILA|nr:unnamed protein product [Brachionus calyciflorus]